MTTRRELRARRSRRRAALALGGAALTVGAVVGGLALGAEPFDPDPTPAPTEPTGPSGTAGGGSPTPRPTPTVSDATFTILSAGDVLPHESVNRAAELPGGGWDFVPLMSGVEEWTAGADLALCSLEVPLAPPGEEISAYPVFGAPEELVAGLGELGWDGCNLATNHSMDRGVAGLEHTLDVLDEAGMGHVGTARTQRESAQPQLYTLQRGGRELTVAHLAATTVDNGLPPPAATPWAVTAADPEALNRQARAAREAGADIVVASIHWGTEYVHEPIEEQLEIADALAEGGQIDVIFGNHSHTPQPLERLDGGPAGTGMWVAWSMGNFLSNQDDQCCTMETGTGVMVNATVAAPAGAPARVTGLDWAPVTVDRAGGQRIWPLEDLLGGNRPEGLTLDDATLAERRARVTEVMGTGRERQGPPRPTGPEPTVVPRER
ncbi:CapA family protein [Georgenia alba]|uniref:CapA family protein n=1 Tax=Georgenia alba TaxID=2233858 RepID=A0ABW2Q7V8_9MICO